MNFTAYISKKDIASTLIKNMINTVKKLSDVLSIVVPKTIKFNTIKIEFKVNEISSFLFATLDLISYSSSDNLSNFSNSFFPLKNKHIEGKYNTTTKNINMYILLLIKKSIINDNLAKTPASLNLSNPRGKIPPNTPPITKRKIILTILFLSIIIVLLIDKYIFNRNIKYFCNFKC